MSLKIIQFLAALLAGILLSFTVLAKTTAPTATPLTRQEIIDKLGWIQTNQNRCGGYYIEEPFTYPQALVKTNAVQITSSQLLFAQHGTSVGQGKVTITRPGQQIVANKAYLYRDPSTGKVNSIELFNNVTIREPNSLILADHGNYELSTKAKSLEDILYRTAIYSNTHAAPKAPGNKALQTEHKIYQLSAWGQAADFSQNEPMIYEFDKVSYSTCPPSTRIWQVKASHMTLNKDTGRGVATHARIYIKSVPIFYTPYLNFPIDARRKTGFLWPTIGASGLSGPFVTAPFYWNLAPNYDTTITPAYLSKRGFQITDLFRYLTPESNGNFTVAVLPNDQAFSAFQDAAQENPIYSQSGTSQGELHRLENASTTRKALNWQNTTRFNEHWSNAIDFNWVSDDYYLRDFSNNLNQVTQNQLLQQGEMNYKGQNWNFIGRIQAYQTLHPVDQNSTFNNQYTRAPQLILNGDYPENAGGIEYFIANEATHFDIRIDPGSTTKQPVGNRVNIQPGFSRPFNSTFLSIVPRLQFAFTQYDVGDVLTANQQNPSRALPIFDLNNTFYFDRNINWLNQGYRQTLEPQIYYTYIPSRNQNNLPVFDTTVSTLTYDQLFMYNRFTGIDRINDANQVALGLTTRFIEEQTGLEKIKAAAGQIYYFKHRSVTLCSTDTDPADCQSLYDPNNYHNRSPLTGLVTYAVNVDWSATANTIWNQQTNKVDNQSIALHYQPPSTQKIVNLGYNFVRNGEFFAGDVMNSSATNLSVTDVSFDWPVFHDWSAVGRWTQNWNHHYFQNVLYGLQYDSCCWAIRLVAGRIFTSLNLNNTPQYNAQFYVQFALKGLGTVPVTGGDPTQILTNSISGYQSNFGRDF